MVFDVETFEGQNGAGGMVGGLRAARDHAKNCKGVFDANKVPEWRGRREKAAALQKGPSTALKADPNTYVRPKETKVRTTTCKNCLQTGHNTRTCTNETVTPLAKGKKGKVCRKCGESGHNARTCGVGNELAWEEREKEKKVSGNVGKWGCDEEGRLCSFQMYYKGKIWEPGEEIEAKLQVSLALSAILCNPASKARRAAWRRKAGKARLAKSDRLKATPLCSHRLISSGPEMWVGGERARSIKARFPLVHAYV